MQTLTKLQAYGYRAELSAPDKIRLTWTREGTDPDPARVEPLLAELRARKAEAIEALRQGIEIDLSTRPPFATMYRGRPTVEALAVADAILDHLAGVGPPEAETAILAAVGGDETLTRNVLYRLAVEGVVESLRGGLYRVPDYPPAPPNLPERCPLRGGPVPAGCRFEARLFKRMVAEGALPLPGGRCPVRHTCKAGGSR